MAMCSQILAYIGPETVLPATSLLAALGGLLLAFGSSVSAAVARAFRFVFRLPAPPAPGVGRPEGPAGPP
jgi:hypothetical protein